MFIVERLENTNRNNEENEQNLQWHHPDRNLDGSAHLPFSWSLIVTFFTTETELFAHLVAVQLPWGGHQKCSKHFPFDS